MATVRTSTMSNSATTRFFDTSGCLNLSRPTSGARVAPSKPPARVSLPIRGQVKIDLYNFDHVDFLDSKYVLTSPRSLQACARLNIKPANLLPTKLADLTSETVRLSTLLDIRDAMEIERLDNLRRCREEREKLIQEETGNNRSSSADVVQSKPSHARDKSPKRRVSIGSARSESNIVAKVRSTGRTMVKPSVVQWPLPIDQDETPACVSAGFLDDVRRMDRSLQRMGTSGEAKTQRYVNGLENVKQIIEQRANLCTSAHDCDSLTFEKKQYELLLGHYDHELKIEKARENVRRTEKEKAAERQEVMMHEFMDHTLAEERRQNELRRKLDKLHHSRQLFEVLQAKNHESQVADVEKRRAELLRVIKRKDRRTDHFVKDKEETVKLSRTLAKSSQDTRAYLRGNNENFDQKAKRAELTRQILVSKYPTHSDLEQ